MKTLYERLSELPDGYRERALLNCKDGSPTECCRSIARALEVAFDWDCTPEGADFWCEVYWWADGDAPHLPPLPEECVSSNSILPTDAQERKNIPVYSGVCAYFPRALCAIAKLSKEGNDIHNPGKPLHWDRSKSGDELDALMRHLLEGEWVAVAWRALGNLEKHLEEQDG